jgi:DNA-binding Lrp family transcriptional regulator
MIAYVLIQTESLGIPVADRVRQIPGVESADDIDGPYDAIAVARSDSSTTLMERIVEPIRRLEGVQRALVAPLSDGAAERLTADRAA